MENKEEKEILSTQICTFRNRKELSGKLKEVKNMLGAIFGDIVGSVYERFNTKREDFPLLSEWSRPTDDSIMTLAVAKALMNSRGENDEEIKREVLGIFTEEIYNSLKKAAE